MHLLLRNRHACFFPGGTLHARTLGRPASLATSSDTDSLKIASHSTLLIHFPSQNPGASQILNETYSDTRLLGSLGGYPGHTVPFPSTVTSSEE